MSILASSTFTSDENPLSEGGVWSTQTGEGVMEKSAGVARPTGFGDDSAANYNAVTWPDNQYCQAVLSTDETESDRGPALGLRMSSSANTWYRITVSHTSGGTAAISIGRFLASAFTQRGTRDTTWTDGDTFRAEITGQGASTVIKVFKNGVQVGTDLTDDASAINSGRVGIGHGSLNLGTRADLDNWEGGDFAAATTPLMGQICM